MDLRLDRTDRPDGTACLTITGDIDLTSSDRFRRTVAGLVDDPAVTGVLLDAARLDFIDSNGVTVLVKAHRAAAERGICLRVTNAQDPVCGLLELLGVYEMLTGVRV